MKKLSSSQKEMLVQDPWMADNIDDEGRDESNELTALTFLITDEVAKPPETKNIVTGKQIGIAHV